MQEILSKKYIGERIKMLRINNDHSQLFIADILNLSRSNYSQIELGNQYPTFETLYTISRYYSKSYEWLIHGFEDANGGQLSTKEISILFSKKLKQSPIVSNGKKQDIKLVSVKNKVHSRYVDGLDCPEYLKKLPVFDVPLVLTKKGIYRAFKTEDNQIINTIYSGDVVIGRSLSNFAEVKINEIYVVVTQTNIILCRIYSILPVKEVLVCKTDDLNNDWFTLPFDTIQEMWQAEGKYSTRLEPFITDLNLNVKHLEQSLTKIEREITGLRSSLNNNQ